MTHNAYVTCIGPAFYLNALQYWTSHHVENVCHFYSEWYQNKALKFVL